MTRVIKIVVVFFNLKYTNKFTKRKIRQELVVRKNFDPYAQDSSTGWARNNWNSATFIFLDYEQSLFPLRDSRAKRTCERVRRLFSRASRNNSRSLTCSFSSTIPERKERLLLGYHFPKIINPNSASFVRHLLSLVTVLTEPAEQYQALVIRLLLLHPSSV